MIIPYLIGKRSRTAPRPKIDKCRLGVILVFLAHAPIKAVTLVHFRTTGCGKFLFYRTKILPQRIPLAQ